MIAALLATDPGLGADHTGLLIALFSAIEVLGITLILHFLPNWSRPDHAFALTVPPTFRDSAEGRAVLGLYRRTLWVGAAVALAASLIPLVWGSVLPVLFSALFLVVAWYWAYFAARREIRALVPSGTALAPEPAAYPLATGAALVAAGREGNLNGGNDLLVGGWLGQLAPFAVLAAAAAWLTSRWEAIPERYVTHWNGRMEADAWAQKDALSVLMPLLMGVGFCLMLVGIAVWMGRSTRWAAPAPGEGEQRAHRRRAIGWMLLGTNLFLALVMSVVAISPLVQTSAGARHFVVWLLVGSMIGPILLLVLWFVIFGKYFTAQGRKSEAATPDLATPDLRQEDRFWKGGLIYYNPADPAVWVEKRIGIGYTLNMARPAAWGFMLAVVLVPLALVLLVSAFS